MVIIGRTTIGKRRIVRTSKEKQNSKNKIDFNFENCKLKI